MRTDCDMIKDLLPLYAEGMVRERTKALIEEHFTECAQCRRLYDEMKSPAPKVEYNKETAESFGRYVRKSRRRHTLKVAGLTLLAVAAVMVIKLMFGGMLMAGMMRLTGDKAPVTDTDPAHYTQYMGENAKEEYRDKWGMDESIFPEKLDGLDVKEYSMTRYDPWDAQFLSYLTVQYDNEGYAAEVQRLADCGISKYMGYYSVTGFEGGAPLAVNADDYYGFVYAIDTPDEENSITYVEIIFCNYCLDVECTDYIPEKYLPDGFDASENNPYSLANRK